MKQKHWQVSVFDKTSETVRNDTFYVTDTEAYLTFELIDKDFTPDSASVTVYNTYGKVTIHVTRLEVVDGIVRYELPVEAIRHSGDWRTQVVFTKDNEDYTTEVIEFRVGGHLLNNKKPPIVVIENWNHFIKHAEGLVDDWKQLEKIRQVNERQREQAESARQKTFETNEAERESAFEERYGQLEEEYAPKLTEVTAQLAHTDSQVNSRIDKIISLAEGSTTGDAQLLDGAISADGTDNENVGNNIRKTQTGEMIMNNAISVEKINASDKSVNILNPDDLVQSVFHFGNIGDPVERRTTEGFKGNIEPIPVESGDVVRFNQANKQVYFVGVDNEGIVIQRGPTRNATYIEITVAEGVTGFYTSVTIELLDTSMITINNRMPSIYVGHTQKKTLEWLDYKRGSIKPEHLSPEIDLDNIISASGFEEERIAWFGTSIDWQDGRAYGGSGAIARGWQTHFEEQLGVIIDNQGISGSCMTNGTRYASLTNTGVEKILAYNNFHNTQYVVINHATNDLALTAPIGTIKPPTVGSGSGSFDDTTYFGAYQKAIEHIQSQNPEIKIVLVTPMHRNTSQFNSFNKNEIDVSLMDYRDAILQLSLYYSLKVIDMTTISGVNMNNLGVYTMDGLHLNDEGYEYSAVPFINEFKTLKPLNAT